MKKVLFGVLVATAMYACSGNDKQSQANSTPAPAPQAAMSGQDIIAKYDCLTCHKVDEKLIGPAYKEVAKKYAGQPDTIVMHLANKVIKGGQGVWGDVPMAAHPTVSEADAKTMVEYILTLK